jgi:GntR family negative regulator for fad regulon and positive regulator of fabA
MKSIFDGLQKPMKLAQHAESCLLRAILEGDYPPGSVLPAERKLAEKIGVTRPTLREALQRMARDGWLDIHHGKPTIIRDYMTEGGLGVISTMTRLADRLPANFIGHFLDVRSVILPAVSRMAAENRPAILEANLAGSQNLPDTPDAYTDYDWNLQLDMATHSGNPFFRIILNSFALMYSEWGLRYFRAPEARLLSAQYYAALLELVRKRDGIGVEARVRLAMTDVMTLWESRMGDMEK